MWDWRWYCTIFCANGDKNTWKTNYWNRRQDLEIINKLTFHGKQTQKSYKWGREFAFKFWIIFFRKNVLISSIISNYEVSFTIFLLYAVLLQVFLYGHFMLIVTFWTIMCFFFISLEMLLQESNCDKYTNSCLSHFFLKKKKKLDCVSCHNMLWILSFGEALFTRCPCCSV